MKPVHVKDLPDQIGTGGARAFLFCQVCGGEYSAHKGDYFMAAPDTVMRCCKRPLRLVTRHTELREVAV